MEFKMSQIASGNRLVGSVRGGSMQNEVNADKMEEGGK